MLSNLLALLQNFQLGGHSSNGMSVSFQAGLHARLQLCGKYLIKPISGSGYALLKGIKGILVLKR